MPLSDRPSYVFPALRGREDGFREYVKTAKKIERKFRNILNIAV